MNNPPIEDKQDDGPAEDHDGVYELPVGGPQHPRRDEVPAVPPLNLLIAQET